MRVCGGSFLCVCYAMCQCWIVCVCVCGVRDSHRDTNNAYNIYIHLKNTQWVKNERFKKNRQDKKSFIFNLFDLMF